MTVSGKRFLQNQKQRPTLELSTGTNQEPEPIKITTSEAQTVSEAINKNQPSAVIAKQREQQLMQENKPLKGRERTTGTSDYVKNLPEMELNVAIANAARDLIDEAQYRVSTFVAGKGQLSATEELEKAGKQAVSEFEQNVPSTNNLFQSVFDGRNTAENSIDKITTGLQPYEMKWLNEAGDTVYGSNGKTTISQPTIHTLDFEGQLNDAYNSVTYEFAQNGNVITVEQLQETYPFFQTLPKDVLGNFIEDCLYDVQQGVKRPLQEYADHYEGLAMIDNYTNRQDSLINVMSDPTALQYAISPYIAGLVQMEGRTKEDWEKYVESANTIKGIVTYLNNNGYNITSASDYAIAKTFENSIPELKEALRVYDEFNITENEFNQLYKHFIENVDARGKALSDPDSLQFKQIAREYAYANLKNFQQEYVNSLNKEIANPNSQYNKYFEKWRNSGLAIVDQVASLFEGNGYQIDGVFYDNNGNEIERDEVSTGIIDGIIDMIIETGKTFSDTNYDIKIFEELPEGEEKNEYQTKILADVVNSIVYGAFAYTPQGRAAQAITRIPVLGDKIIVPAIEWVMGGISEQALNLANALNFSKGWTDDTKEKYSEAMANLGTILAGKTMGRLVKTGKVRLEDFGDRTALFKNINAWSKYITKHITELDTISLSEAIKRNNLAGNELPETPGQPTARGNVSTLQLLKSDIELARKYFNDTYKLALEQTNGGTFVDNLYQFIKDSTQKKVEIISPEEGRTIGGREIEAEVSSIGEEPTISEKTWNNVKEGVKVVEDLTEDLRQGAESLASKFAERRKTRAEEKQKKETEIKDKEFQKEEDLSDEEMNFLRENEYSKIITDIVDRETRIEPNKKGGIESVTTKKQRLNDSDISSDVLSEGVKGLQQYVDSLLDAQEKIGSLYDELSETQNIYFAGFFSDGLFKRILDQYKIRYDANTGEFVPTKGRLIGDKERDAGRYLKNFIEETKKIINRGYVSEYDIRKLRERSADPKDFTNTGFIAAIKKTLRSAINEYLDKTQQARVTRLIDQGYSDIKDNLGAIKDLFDKNRETKDNAAKKILQRDNDTIKAIDKNIIPGFKDLVDASRLAPKIVRKVIAKKKEIAPTKGTKFVGEIVRYVTAMTVASIGSSMGGWLLGIMMGALGLKVGEITGEWLKKKITKTKPSLKKYKEYVDRLDTTEEKKAQLKKNAEDIEKIKIEQADKFDTIYAKAMKMLLDEAKAANPAEPTEITTVDDMVEIVESDPDYKPAKELAELIKETTTSLQEISVDIADKNLKGELVTEDALREQSQQDFIEFVNSLSESSEGKTTKSKRKFEEWDDDSLYGLFDTETQMPKSEVIEKLSSEELIDLINEFERRILTEQIAEATDISTINREKAAAKIERQRLKEYKEKTGEEQIQFMAEQERLRESLGEQNEGVDGSEQYIEIERTSTPEEIERGEIYLQGGNPRQIIHSTLEGRQNAKEFYEENGWTPKAKNLKEGISRTSSWEKIFEYKDGQTKLSAITAKINRVKKQGTMNSKSNKQYREKALAEKERLEKLLKGEGVEIVDEEQLIFEPKPKEVEAEEIKEAERIQEEIDIIESNETPQDTVDQIINEEQYLIDTKKYNPRNSNVAEREIKHETPKEKDIRTDSNGEEVTFYHGTPQGGFEEFSMDFRGKSNDRVGLGDYGRGMYFTPYKETAEGYAKNSKAESTNPEIYETKLRMENPLRLDLYKEFQRAMNELAKEDTKRGYSLLSKEHSENIDRLMKEFGLTEELYDKYEDIISSLGDNRFDVDIRGSGFDGIISEDGKEVIVPDTDQIIIKQHYKLGEKPQEVSSEKVVEGEKETKPDKLSREERKQLNQINKEIEDSLFYKGGTDARGSMTDREKIEFTNTLEPHEEFYHASDTNIKEGTFDLSKTKDDPNGLGLAVSTSKDNPYGGKKHQYTINGKNMLIAKEGTTTNESNIRDISEILQIEPNAAWQYVPLAELTSIIRGEVEAKFGEANNADILKAFRDVTKYDGIDTSHGYTLLWNVDKINANAKKNKGGDKPEEPTTPKKPEPNKPTGGTPLVDVAKDGTVNKEPGLGDYTTDQIQKRIDELKKKRQDNGKKLYAQELSELRVLQDLLKRQIERENREEGSTELTDRQREILNSNNYGDEYRAGGAGTSED